jgi:hypothetical protein
MCLAPMVQQLSPSWQRPHIHYLRLLGYCFRFYISSNHMCHFHQVDIVITRKLKITLVKWLLLHKNQFLVENVCTAQRYDNLPYVIGKQTVHTFSLLYTVTLTQPFITMIHIAEEWLVIKENLWCLCERREMGVNISIVSQN